MDVGSPEGRYAADSQRRLTMPFDRHGSKVMEEDECRTLLKQAGVSGTVGRLAINRERSPFVIPVNFSVCDELILVRLRPGFAAHHLDGATVTFEIDHVEPYSKKGWSVEVEGPATLLTYEEVARLGHNIPHPLVMYPGIRVFSIRPDRISGRSICHDYEGGGSAASPIDDVDSTRAINSRMGTDKMQQRNGLREEVNHLDTTCGSASEVSEP
jgi:hypothetical protein